MEQQLLMVLLEEMESIRLVGMHASTNYESSNWLAAGNYTVTVTDQKGCIQQDT